MSVWLFQVLILTILTVFTSFFCALSFLQTYFKDRRNARRRCSNKLEIAFFHPYCNAGGGGEKVLWHAVHIIQSQINNVNISIYTGDICYSSKDIIDKVKERFNIDIRPEIEFVYLQKRKWIEAAMYPYFTLIGQSIGSMFLGLEAIFTFPPDVFIDTTGCAFTLPIFSFIGGCLCASYVHYPTISTDMLNKVSSRANAVNNRSFIANSRILSGAKVYYYKLFAWLYSKCGSLCDCVMVNSSWTEDHINDIWKKSLHTYKVYPPCDTTSFKELQLAPDFGTEGEIRIVYLAQFRPEKDHPLQLRSLHEVKRIIGPEIWSRIQLLFIGSCRNHEDEERVERLKQLCKELGIADNVKFKINLPFEALKKELESSVIGTHSMWNEHFGISVVECMAAGLIMVAHKSGGPKADIISESDPVRTGYLASDEKEYAQALVEIISQSSEQRMAVRLAAKKSVDRFSNEQFYKSFLAALAPCIAKARSKFFPETEDNLRAG